MNSNMTEQLDQLFRMWDRGLCPGAQVLIRQHGKTLYEKCFGYGNLENKLKIHKESIFHVASISKEFTVMSILLLWKEGKLDLDINVLIRFIVLISTLIYFLVEVNSKKIFR